MTAFGMTLTRLQQEGTAFEAVLPTMPHLTEAIAAALKLEGACALSSATTRSARLSASRMRRSRNPAR
jgi:hypothetical protein